ncbi:MAG: RNA polymerase sigma factor [Saprospiraceae bacterium]|nr:RNA polymerase sigma factor [Saprospiraceae bacterium]
MHTPTPHPDQYLLDGLLRADRAVIDEIYRRFFPPLRRHIVRNSGRGADAKDVFQECLLTIYRKKETGGTILHEPFGSYLHRLGKWLWLNELKKRKRLTELHHQFSAAQPSQTDSQAALSQRQHDDTLFKKAFDTLAPLCQQVLRLSWAGFNLKQIGQQIGKSHGYLRRKRPECVRAFVGLLRERKQG